MNTYEFGPEDEEELVTDDESDEVDDEEEVEDEEELTEEEDQFPEGILENENSSSSNEDGDE